ncbi:hypothetical protein GN244_ATG06037 [Phytophthora infestans]|uniref:Uncharacterized protein n=1 Tax=Phytophthora infestans TaxID=4787 RepID=A0A833WM49_PHYIN|nr:hypothetical protein GN244_ATG06037 [Phytophthora infestans]
MSNRDDFGDLDSGDEPAEDAIVDENESEAGKESVEEKAADVAEEEDAQHDINAPSATTLLKRFLHH